MTRAVCWRSEFAGVVVVGGGLLEFLRFSQLLEGTVFRRTTQQRRSGGKIEKRKEDIFIQ